VDLDEFEAAGEHAEARLLDDDPGSTILAEIEAVDPSLVVVGHGRYHSPPGSTALTVSQAAETSVMVVPYGLG
jgi:nucleotide-binding universal stress UspA family protein